MREKDRKRKGFTLAEMLLTLGIMVILAGISFVALTQYQRKLKLLEMDGTAEEIFMAAQNEMSMLESNGTLEQLSEAARGIRISAAGTDEVDATGNANATGNADAAGHACYALIHNAGDSGDVGASLLSYLLPFGVIDDTVRIDGNYRIEYDYTASVVTAVYYSKTASFLGNSGDAYAFDANGNDAAALQQAAGDKNLRQHFDGSGTEAVGGAIVGYYGGSSKAVPTEELTAPVLSIENGARLLLHIKLTVSVSSKNTITLTVKGRSSGKSAEITIQDSDLRATTAILTQSSVTSGTIPFYMAKAAGDTTDYVLCLDSVTENNAHFNKLFPGLTPGEDIEISAIRRSTDGYAREAKSNTVSANSLFASVETETVPTDWTFDSSGMGSLKENSAAAVPTAMIANVRHLENLDPDVSGLSADTADCIQAAVQTGDIVYAKTSTVKDYSGAAVSSEAENSFVEEIARYAPGRTGENLTVYLLSGREGSGYRPIQNSALRSYDGKNYAIVNLYSSAGGDRVGKGQGLFSAVTGEQLLSIRDLQLKNCQFTSSVSSAAGALVGRVENAGQLVVQGIETENCQVTSSGNVGGLIGQLSAAGKLYVNECGILGEYGSISSNNTAGGFIGNLQGSAETYIANSTASVYVSSGSTAGGFIGSISGQADIRFSYVGGHTKDGAYPDPENSNDGKEGQGRWNVQSGGTAGGFIGQANAAKLELSGCYSTASVKARQAGAFLGGGSLSGGAVTCCYANGKISGASALDENTEKLFTADFENKGSSYAVPYDPTLKENGNPQYPYMTAVELYTAALNAQGTKVTSGSRSLKYGSEHIGDFCPEEETVETILRFLNGPRLYAEVFTPLKENGTNYLTMVLTGTAENDVSQQTANTFQFEAAVAADHTVTLNRISSPNSSDKHMQYNQAKVISVGDKNYLVYRILLDDISVPYMHFLDITKGIRVGSAITGYATAEQNPNEGWYTDDTYRKQTVDTTWMSTVLTAANTELNLKGSTAVLEQYDWGSAVITPFDTDNSLFGRDSDPFAANKLSVNVSSCRHLQNLDQYVSGFEKNGGNRDKDMEATNIAAFRAAQTADLDWDQYIQAVGKTYLDFCLYKPSSDSAISINRGCFYGIQNLMLSEYDGQRHAISNLRVQGYKDDWDAAGLFAAVPENQSAMLTIQNLALCNVNSLANQKNKEGSAAALVGYYGSSKGLTVQNVVISGAEVNAKMDAGGLIGLAKGSGNISIQNCVVYEGEKDSSGNRPYKLLISSEGGANNRSSTSDSASAGGLIGRIPSGTSLTVSISGCSVYGESALILAKGKGNDSSRTDDSAGGLVGTILSGSLNIDNCGVAAYIYAPYGDCTGGLVADFSASGRVSNCYVGGLTATINNGVGFQTAVAVDYNSQTITTPGGYNIYGHLATGGLMGYCHHTVEIENCFMAASVSSNGANYTGGMLGQMGTQYPGNRVKNCYVAGKVFNPPNVTGYNIGSVAGYCMYQDLSNYFGSTYVLDKFGLNGYTNRFVGSHRNKQILGCSVVQKTDLTDQNQTNVSTETVNASLTGSYPLQIWTHLYSPTEILAGSTDLNAAQLRYIGDWSFS